MRDLFSKLLVETCSNVTTEPELQPLDGVSLQTRGANRQDGARLHIKAGGFWGRSRFEATFFDVRVFNPLKVCHTKVDRIRSMSVCPLNFVVCRRMATKLPMKLPNAILYAKLRSFRGVYLQLLTEIGG